MKQHLDDVTGILNSICQTAKRQELYFKFINCKDNNFSLVDTTIDILLRIEKITVSNAKMKIDKCYEGTVIIIQIIWVKNVLFENNENTEINVEDDDSKLPIVYPPFLPSLNSNQASNIYTLIVDLDETLVHMIEVY